MGGWNEINANRGRLGRRAYRLRDPLATVGYTIVTVLNYIHH
jgi:hypothetical protein